jgi:hypothetical protein
MVATQVGFTTLEMADGWTQVGLTKVFSTHGSDPGRVYQSGKRGLGGPRWHFPNWNGGDGWNRVGVAAVEMGDGWTEVRLTARARGVGWTQLAVARSGRAAIRSPSAARRARCRDGGGPNSGYRDDRSTPGEDQQVGWTQVGHAEVGMEMGGPRWGCPQGTPKAHDRRPPRE